MPQLHSPLSSPILPLFSHAFPSFIPLYHIFFLLDMGQETGGFLFLHWGQACMSTLLQAFCHAWGGPAGLPLHPCLPPVPSGSPLLSLSSSSISASTPLVLQQGVKYGVPLPGESYTSDHDRWSKSWASS